MFRDRCKVHPELTGKKKHWILHRTKIKGVALRFDIGRENAQVMIELFHRSERQRLKAFEILEKYKPLLESGFENGLEWEFYFQREETGQEVCRIYTILENVDVHRQNQWPDIFNFFIENMSKLEENFLEIRDLVQEEIKSVI